MLAGVNPGPLGDAQHHMGYEHRAIGNRATVEKSLTTFLCERRKAAVDVPPEAIGRFETCPFCGQEVDLT